MNDQIYDTIFDIFKDGYPTEEFLREKGFDGDYGAMLGQVIGHQEGKGNVNVIRKLNELGFTQACLTNNFIPSNENQPDMIDLDKKAEVFDLFDFVFESKEIGLRKPDQAFYDHVIKEVNILPNKIIFLDDLGINLKPAKAMGITTIKVISESQAKKDLGEILNINF